MKPVLRLFAVLALWAFCASVPAAHAAGDASVAFVDMQMLLTGSNAGKDLQQQIETKKTEFLAVISKEEQKLHEEQKGLSEQKEALTPEEFSKKAKAFEAKLAATRRMTQEKKKILETGANKALEELRSKILKAVQSVSDEKGYELVVSRQSIVIGAKGLDITEDVLAILNRDVVKIDLELK
ncbi:MAG: OmpH family outer membrane protein [Alphaproteobacteria bacterium]